MTLPENWVDILLAHCFPGHEGDDDLEFIRAELKRDPRAALEALRDADPVSHARIMEFTVLPDG